MGTLYLCAAGNPVGVRLALTVQRERPRWERIVLLDDDRDKHGQDILGVPVIGGFDQLALTEPGDEAVNFVARSTAGRARARERIRSFEIPVASLIHPSVDIFGVTLGRELTIYAQATVSALSTVGDGAVIFGHAVLGHGARLGAGAVLAPGAVVNARVVIGAGGYVGSNASILPDLSVGEGATVGACSSVVEDVPAGATAIGVPAELLGAERQSAKVEAHGEPRDPAPIRAAFASVLGRADVGLDDNFFDLGGSSALALRLARELGTRLELSVTVVDVFRSPTVRRLAERLGAAGSTSAPTLDRAAKRAAARRRRGTLSPA